MSQTEVQLIKDAVIVNADVSGSAAIDVSKISGAMPLAGGTFTDDVTFTGASANIVFDKSDNQLEFADDAKAEFGASGDLEIYHGSNQSQIVDSYGDLRLCSNHIRFRNGAKSSTSFDVDADGATTLYHNGSTKFSTLSDGVKLTDAGKLNLENDSENKSSYIFNSAASTHADITFYTAETGGTAANRWQITKSGMLITAADSTYDIGESSNRVRNGYFDTLYGDGSNLTGVSSDLVDDTSPQLGGTLDCNGQDVQFKSAGGNVKILFDVSDDSLEFADSAQARFGASDDLRVYHNGTHSYVTGHNTGNLYVGTTHANNLIFMTADSGRWSIQSSGSFSLLPEVDNSYDIGHPSYRVRNIYTGDLNLSNKGSSNDVDGTWGSYTIQEGSEDLFLINKRNGKKFKFNLTEVA